VHDIQYFIESLHSNFSNEKWKNTEFIDALYHTNLLHILIDNKWFFEKNIEKNSNYTLPTK
jgi:hypothetical protein